MPLLQSTRSATLSSPLGGDQLALKSLTTTEQVGRLFQFEIEAVSERGDIRAKELLGQPVCVAMECPRSGAKRYFHGMVCRFSQAPRERRYFHYHLTVVPWLWFLTRSSDCRIFQNKTVPDILTEVLRAQGFTDFKLNLTGRYEPWEYCVQYRETDFNFVSRLMEQEGIYYFYQHEADRHFVVLADSPGAHKPFPGYESITYRARLSTHSGDEHVREWLSEQRHYSGTYAHTDYDFTRPKTPLEARSQIPGDSARPNSEIFDFPGEYTQLNGGQDWARVRMEEMRMENYNAHGNADARGLVPGCVFTLAEPPIPDEAGSYLVLSTSISVQVDVYETNDQGADEPFACSFTAVKAAEPFRSVRITPKPTIQSVQTAVVTGPAGEEIHTDQYGRIKVQFHWDRAGKKNENSSCWMRVATAWAGNQWGMVSLPRIGQEVVVAFLEGDPDQPLVIGSVYNALQMPPYTLPANQTQSGIKTRSSKGGNPEAFNEICFEDKKGEELLYIRAEKDLTTAVENCESHWVGNDRLKTVDHDETTEIRHDRTETVLNNESITIMGDRTEKVMKNEDSTIVGNRTEKVLSNEDITIVGTRTEKVAQSEDIMIGMSRTEKVGLSESVTIGVSRSTTIAASDTFNVGVAQSTTVGAKASTTVGGAMSFAAGAAISVAACGAVTISAASITLTAATVNIVSPAVTIAGRLVKPGPIPPIIP